MSKSKTGFWGLVIILFGVVIVQAVSALPAPKVFVCKYVGKPGTDERLQTGNNPISVSSNAIKDYQGVGSYFNDAQGRSYVLAVDIGQPEPNVSECPQPPKDVCSNIDGVQATVPDGYTAKDGVCTKKDTPVDPNPTPNPTTNPTTPTTPATPATQTAPTEKFCGKGDPADC